MVPSAPVLEQLDGVFDPRLVLPMGQAANAASVARGGRLLEEIGEPIDVRIAGCTRKVSEIRHSAAAGEHVPGRARDGPTPVGVKVRMIARRVSIGVAAASDRTD